MAIPEDDPRITAYALGELSGAERAAFEAELALQPELQPEIEAIQQAGGLLSNAFQHEERPRLSTARRAAIQKELQKVVSSSRLRMIVQWKALHKIGAAAAVMLCASLLWFSYSNSRNLKRVADAHAQIRRLHEAMARYAADHQQLPPDTGFGLDPENAAIGAGKTYDPGALWRFLGQKSVENGKEYGPYIQFSSAELIAYNDPVRGPSFYVADPWGMPVGYVGDSRRVVHNHGHFDIFSAGPDRHTGNDLPQLGSNLAYDGVDNNSDGIVDNAQELGAGRMNGAMTVANAEAGTLPAHLDDVNNWDE